MINSTMHQGDTSNPYYQPPFQNPNPNPNPNPIDPHAHTAPYASAPPLSSNFTSGYPHYPPSSDHAPDFHYPYDQNPVPHLNPSYSEGSESGSISNQQGEGVYRYEGGNVEPYGARGTAGSRSASETMFDDYGRPISVSKRDDYGGSTAPNKVVEVIPKFRVKLLSEGLGQNDLDVLCQIGLDGICMLDPATSRILRIYTLDTVTRWELLDSYIFAFWAKTPVDVEPKRIRLKSNGYTTNIILDTVTAASVQFKEMGDRKESDYLRASEQQTERKKSIADWMNFVKPLDEEKDHWIPDETVTNCTSCSVTFNAFVRKHHCRNCGEIFCDKCTQGRTPLNADEQAQPVRVCDRCMGEVTERLENAKEVASRSGAARSHEDLAKRLEEEMNKNAKASSGSPSNGSHREMREVECPTCTVHLQVQVPSSGSKTIECSVCQHPFHVNAH